MRFYQNNLINPISTFVEDRTPWDLISKIGLQKDQEYEVAHNLLDTKDDLFKVDAAKEEIPQAQALQAAYKNTADLISKDFSENKITPAQAASKYTQLARKFQLEPEKQRLEYNRKVVEEDVEKFNQEQAKKGIFDPMYNPRTEFARRVSSGEKPYFNPEDVYHFGRGKEDYNTVYDKTMNDVIASSVDNKYIAGKDEYGNIIFKEGAEEQISLPQIQNIASLNADRIMRGKEGLYRVDQITSQLGIGPVRSVDDLREIKLKDGNTAYDLVHQQITNELTAAGAKQIHRKTKDKTDIQETATGRLYAKGEYEDKTGGGIFTIPTEVSSQEHPLLKELSDLGMYNSKTGEVSTIASVDWTDKVKASGYNLLTRFSLDPLALQEIKRQINNVKATPEGKQKVYNNFISKLREEYSGLSSENKDNQSFMSNLTKTLANETTYALSTVSSYDQNITNNIQDIYIGKGDQKGVGLLSTTKLRLPATNSTTDETLSSLGIKDKKESFSNAKFIGWSGFDPNAEKQGGLVFNVPNDDGEIEQVIASPTKEDDAMFSFSNTAARAIRENKTYYINKKTGHTSTEPTSNAIVIEPSIKNNRRYAKISSVNDKNLPDELYQNTPQGRIKITDSDVLYQIEMSNFERNLRSKSRRKSTITQEE